MACSPRMTCHGCRDADLAGGRVSLTRLNRPRALDVTPPQTPLAGVRRFSNRSGALDRRLGGRARHPQWRARPTTPNGGPVPHPPTAGPSYHQRRRAPQARGWPLHRQAAGVLSPHAAASCVLCFFVCGRAPGGWPPPSRVSSWHGLCGPARCPSPFPPLLFGGALH